MAKTASARLCSRASRLVVLSIFILIVSLWNIGYYALRTSRNSFGGIEQRWKSLELDVDTQLEYSYIPPTLVLEFSTPIAHGLYGYARFMSSGSAPAMQDVTLVTTCDTDSVKLLQTLASAWRGPLSVAVMVERSESDLERLATAVNSTAFPHWRPDIHVLMRTGCAKESSRMAAHLANLAIKSARTDFIFVVDAARLPPQHAYDRAVQLSSAERSALGFLRSVWLFPTSAPPASESARPPFVCQHTNKTAGRDQRRPCSVAAFPAVLAARRAGVLPQFDTQGCCCGWVQELEEAGYHIRESEQRAARREDERPNLGWDAIARRSVIAANLSMLPLQVPECTCGGGGCGGEDGVVFVCREHTFVKHSRIAEGAVEWAPDVFAFPNAVRARSAVRRREVTLVTHMTVNPSKLHRLLLLAGRWEGPISCAVALSSSGVELAELERFVEQHAQVLRRVSVHVLVAAVDPYPVNHQRNLAVGGAESDWVFHCDIDFMPTERLEQQLRRRLVPASLEEAVANSKTAWVVPAFDQSWKGGIASQAVEDIAGAFLRLPATKADLQAQINQREMHPFSYDDHHAPTQYKRWFGTDASAAPYDTEWVETFEPFVVIAKGGQPLVPAFDGGFRGYGRNKLAWTKEIRYAGFTYKVLAEGWLVHMWHPGKGVTRANPAAAKLYDSMQLRLRHQYLRCDVHAASEAFWPRVFLLADHSRPCGRGGASLAERMALALGDVCLPETDDGGGGLDFFDRHADRGAAWYTRQYEQSADCTLLRGREVRRASGVDASQGYLQAAEAMAAMAALIPRQLHASLRFVLVLQNPLSLDRACQPLPRTKTAAALDAAYAASVHTRLLQAPSARTSLSRGLYHAQLTALWSHFPRNQTLVLSADTLAANASDTLRRLADFLGVAGGRQLHKLATSLAAGGVRKLPCVSQAAIEALRRFYHADTDALYPALAADPPPQQPPFPPFRYPPACEEQQAALSSDSHAAGG